MLKSKLRRLFKRTCLETCIRINENNMQFVKKNI